MNIFFEALIWQFFDAPKAILIGWKNFLLFNLNYFSIPLLLRTYFSHWHRYSYSYEKVFEFWKNIEVFVFNMMSRIIGAILRTFFIIIGALVEAAIVIIGLIILLTWLALPFLLISGLFFGIKLLFL
jgi:hypothetical protein